MGGSILAALPLLLLLGACRGAGQPSAIGAPPERVERFDPFITAGVGIRGRVIREDRSPGADLPVRAVLGDRLLGEVRTGPDGDFAFPPYDVAAEASAVDVADFEFSFIVRDGKGHAALDTLRMGLVLLPDHQEIQSRSLTLSGGLLQPLVLRDSEAILARVTSEGVPVEGATVWAEEELPHWPMTGTVTTDGSGVARIEDVPRGAWLVFARAPGRGSGLSRVQVPSDRPVEVSLVQRTLEIGAVDAATGVAVEGIRFEVSERRPIGPGFSWEPVYPPPDLPPSDAAGRTRLQDAGAMDLRFLPIHEIWEYPTEHARPVEVDARATTVRVPVQALRTVSWRVERGEREVPPDGAVLALHDEGWLRDSPWDHEGHRRWHGTIRGDSLVVTGVDPGPFRTMARAPDGSLAHLEVPADSDHGAPIQFRAPRRLIVRVKDEDGNPVHDRVALLTPIGEVIDLSESTDEEGNTVFEGLFPREVSVCPLARTEGGGSEVARVDLEPGDRAIEAVVGREFTVAARFRMGGEIGFPEVHELRWLTPGPPVDGIPHEEWVGDPEKDEALGLLLLRVRPWAPGKPVTLQVTVPGRKRVTREIHPPPAGGEVAVDIDLE